MERINAFTTEAIDSLLENESNLQTVNLELQKLFSELLSDGRSVITGRVKSPNSLKEKIIRKNYHKKYDKGSELIGNLDDIIGVRVLCLLQSNEKETWLFLEKKFDIQVLENQEYYIYDERVFLKKIKLPDNQKNNHPIYKLHGYYMHADKKYNFELQIKSLVHLLWGEVEHMLFYKNYAYNIDSKFYESIMDTFYYGLMGIDLQLENIMKQLTTKDDAILFSELKRMIGKLLYEKLNPPITELFGCSIDMRECYDSLIEIMMQKNYIYDYKKCLDRMQDIIRVINNIDTSKLSGTVPRYQTVKRKGMPSSIRDEIAFVISNNISEHISWALFVYLAGEVCCLEEENDVIQHVSEFFIKILSYNDDIVDLNDAQINYILKVNDLFILELIRKYNYYWIIKNQEYIYDLLKENIDVVHDELSIETEDIDDKAVNLMISLTLLKLKLHFKMDIEKELFIRVEENCNNDMWVPENLISEEFKIMVSRFNNDEDCKIEMRNYFEKKEVMYE